MSFAIAVGVALLLAVGGFTSAPLLIAIKLCATSLGLVVPVLKDAGEASGAVGQVIIAAASIAGFGAVILRSLFFSELSTGLPARLLLLAGLALVVVLLALALMRAGRSTRVDRVFEKLMDTTAQIRIRFATLLLIAFLALAQGWGSRRSSAPSWPERCCGSSTPTPPPCTRTLRSSSTRSATGS